LRAQQQRKSVPRIECVSGSGLRDEFAKAGRGLI
jgi:hypothetical protein